jgi:hypothetical protein
MDSTKHPIRSFILSLLVVAAMGYGVYLGASKLLAQLAAVTSDLGKAIVAAGATITIATVTVVFGKIWEQRVKLQDDVRQRKLPIYQAHIEFMFKTIYASMDKQEADELDPAVVAEFRRFTSQVLVWGGPEVIKTWTVFRLHTWDGTSTRQGFLKFEAFVKALRVELGNRNTSLTDGDLIKLFINDFDSYKPALATAELETNLDVSTAREM